MIGLLQRVRTASVEIQQNSIAEIDTGLLVLVGVEKADNESKAERLLERLLGYHVFSDDQGKMNLSLNDMKGGLLLVPQFTLAADTHKGMRPGFSTAAKPEEAKRLFEFLVDYAQTRHSNVATGEFGADMQIRLVNDGPVTFYLKA